MLGLDPGIRELLVRRLAGDVRVPAGSTVHAVLDRHGLVKRMGARVVEPGSRHFYRGGGGAENREEDDIWNLSSTPRKCLGYRTPIEAFAANLGVALEV